MNQVLIEGQCGQNYCCRMATTGRQRLWWSDDGSKLTGSMHQWDCCISSLEYSITH